MTTRICSFPTTIHTLLCKRFILKWIRAKKLSLNLQKSKYFCSVILYIDSLPNNIEFNDFPLAKFLGVTVDNKLSWKYHIDNICKTISRNIGVMNRLKTHLPSSSLLTLYIIPLWSYHYGLLVWGNRHQTMLNRTLLLRKHCNDFHLPLLRTLLAKNTFIYTAPKFWNSLHNDIQFAPLT